MFDTVTATATISVTYNAPNTDMTCFKQLKTGSLSLSQSQAHAI